MPDLRISYKPALVIAVLLGCMPGISLAGTAMPNTNDALPIYRRAKVEVKGSLRGFSHADLVAFLNRQMAFSDPPPLGMNPMKGPRSDVRVVWSFESLPYAGGTVRYIGPGSSSGGTGFRAPYFVVISATLTKNGVNLEQIVRKRPFRFDDTANEDLAVDIGRITEDLKKAK